MAASLTALPPLSSPAGHLRGSLAMIDPDSESEWIKWIATRLRAERAAVIICIEEQHRKFLEDLNEKFDGLLSIQSNIPGAIPVPSNSNLEVKLCSTTAERDCRVSPSTECSTAAQGELRRGTCAKPKLVFRNEEEIISKSGPAGEHTSGHACSNENSAPQPDRGSRCGPVSMSGSGMQNGDVVYSSISGAKSSDNVLQDTTSSPACSTKAIPQSQGASHSNSKRATVESAWTLIAGENEGEKDRLEKEQVSEMIKILKTSTSAALSARTKTPYQVLDGFVRSQAFEALFAFMIFCNAVTMTLHLQWLGLQTGYDLGFPKYEDINAKGNWPGASVVFDVSEKFFAIVFTIELLMRFVVFRWQSLFFLWSYVDTVIVVLALLPWILSEEWALNPTLVRMARFGKLMRIVRVMRTNTVFGALKLLVTSINASLNTLFWSLCVLLLIQTLFGMLMSYALIDFLSDQNEKLDTRREVFAYFGTFWRSTVTMFEIIFANWGPICRLLLDNVDELSAIFFLVYRCVIGFAILAVIQAVFIQQTMKTAQLDDELCLEMKTRDRAHFVKRLKRVFNEIDSDGDGVISWAEFEPMMEDMRMQGLMATLEISTKDVDTLFVELDDGDGEISIDEFIKGIGSVQGSAKAMDLVTVVNICRRIEAKFDAWHEHYGENDDWKHLRRDMTQRRNIKTTHHPDPLDPIPEHHLHTCSDNTRSKSCSS